MCIYERTPVDAVGNCRGSVDYLVEVMSSRGRRDHGTIQMNLFRSDRFVLHDQPLPGGHRHAVLRDQEEGNGADATGTGPLPVDVDVGLHFSLRVAVLLQADHQVHRAPVASE